ncbi:hypothetical protein [Zunongwangia sp. H14]|uniref:hypothetical protein n=1 Tax=Zunongwangia sp. H14 TaxID=3240792 RepID=UPI003567A2F3
MNIKNTFQIISYLQYPLLLLAAFFVIKPFLNGLEDLKNNPDILIVNYNRTLIFLGLAISFSTLQDTSKTQNKFSERIWRNPKKGKLMILLLTFLTFSTLILGIFLYFFSSNNKLTELSFGVIVLGIGLIGFLKTGIEVFENHRIDKKTNANNG